MIFVNNMTSSSMEKDIRLLVEYQFKFTEVPKLIGDNVNILFYKGSGDTDVIFRNINIETVKKGDTLQLKSDRSARKN